MTAAAGFAILWWHSRSEFSPGFRLSVLDAFVIYEADPLECPKCRGPMPVIALIEDPGVIWHILEHLKLWAPFANERSPPPAVAAWPRHVSWPLSYHPVPDIA